MSLGTKTTTLIAATFCAVLLTASLVLLHYEEQSLKFNILEGLDSQAKIASNGIASFIVHGLRASNAIAAMLPADALVKGRFDEVESHLNKISQLFPAFQNGIFILDAKGKFLVDYPSHPELRGESFAFRDYYQRTLQEQNGVVSQPYKSKRTGTPAVTFTAPVRDATGRIIAIVACSVDLRSQEALGGYAKQKVGKTGYLYVADKSRQLVLHPETQQELTYIEAGKNRVLEAALQGFEGTGETINSVGVPMLLAVRRIPHSDWFVGVQEPQSEAYAPIAQSRTRIISVLSGAMLGAILIGGMVIRRVSRPLQQLEQAASRISADLEDAETKGAYTPSPTALDGLKHIRSRDEIGRLASSIVHLGTRLNLTLASLQLQASALESAANSILITDRDGTIQWVNHAFTRGTGYTSEELVGKTPRILKSGRHDGDFYDNQWKTILSGDVWQGEITNRRKDGSLYVEETIITPVRSADGEISNFIAIKVDTTERKLAERALREAEEQYRTIFEENSIGICNSTVDGDFISVNPAFARIFGYNSPEEMLSRASNARQLYAEADRRREIARQLREQGKAENCEFQVYRKDGSKMWLRASLRAVYSADGSVLYNVAAADDITEHKLLEEQFQQSQKMEAIGSLAGGVAHDFNNLLTVISGYGEMLMQRVGNDPELARMTEAILKAQERGASLTRQLLAFSRRQVLRPTVLDLNTVVVDIVKMLHRLIREDIELVIIPGAELGPVNFDAGQMQQVLMNLAVNAQDAMPNGGKVTIATANVELDESYCQLHTPTKPGPYVMLVVSDTGMGMDKETQAHIFEPFFTTKEVGKGTGLGLSIVYGVVKQSGGYIWVYSEPGLGTTFKIYLPRVADAVPATPKKVAPAMSQGGSETILLVEDDDHLREAIREFLEAEGYVLLTARTPVEAIELSQRHAGSIQLLLTDLVMPGMSGTKFAECLRPKHANLQVLYMSGYTDDAIGRNGGLETDAPFLQKPFALKTLATILRELLALSLQTLR